MRNWDDTYLRYGFYLPDDQSMNAAPQPKCLICRKRHSNSALGPTKSQRHLELIISRTFQKSFHTLNELKEQVRKQKLSLLKTMKTDQDLLLTSY